MSTPARNPFPGPRPYTAADRDLFFGRDKLAQELSRHVLVDACTTVFGPSGAGKSSLMQAAVIPRLEDDHDFRVVRLDAWPPGEPPLPWLLQALFADLEVGPPPEGLSPLEALDEVMSRAEMRSDRPLLIYLDQIEQVLVPNRDPAEAVALFEAVDRLARRPMRGLQLALSLREDYLGRFRDRLRNQRRLLDHGFRVGPLTVGELVDAVCKGAAKGEPPQAWAAEEMRKLLLQVRTPGEAETEQAEGQAAYAQIVCRSLWAERAREEGPRSRTADLNAERILQQYLEATLEALGPDKAEARRLLEDHLITADGARTMRTERELGAALKGETLGKVLRKLEGAAVLRAEEHQGSRYFELGHDWLARWVHDQRQERLRAEEREREEKEREEKEKQRREEEERQRALDRAARRKLGIIAAVAVVVALAMGGVVVWALGQRDKAESAQSAARAAQQKADKNAEEATSQRDAARRAQEEARISAEDATKAKDEQEKQKEKFKQDLGDLETRIQKASLGELAKIRAEVRAKGGLVDTTPPKGIGGDVPPPP